MNAIKKSIHDHTTCENKDIRKCEVCWWNDECIKVARIEGSSYKLKWKEEAEVR